MLKKKKNDILNLLDTIIEMTNIFNHSNNLDVNIKDCIMAFEVIIKQFKNEECLEKSVIKLLEDISQKYKLYLGNSRVESEKFISSSIDAIMQIKQEINEKIKGKLKVVFMPYKISMWDSLETIYLAAKDDEECEVKVVPIPYYKLEKDTAEFTYEGNKFPSNIEITHYSKFILEQEKPDIIFIHNIYDQYNTLTRVENTYFTKNLKKHTDMLVYVPYHISAPYRLKKGEIRYAYNLPGINNVDKVIFAGDFVVDEAIRDGLPKEKIVNLGSPKFDGIYNALHENNSIPEKWGKIKNKKIILLNTGCMFIPSEGYKAFVTLSLIFDITRYIDNIALIWRPHPLTRASVKRYCPVFLDEYDKICDSIKNEHVSFKNIILDEEEEYFTSLRISDLLISGSSSILNSYLMTERPILFLADKLEGDPMLPRNAFYYFWSSEEPWFEVIKNFANGHDRLSDNRKGILNKIYKNVDGTCGEKVWKVIKSSSI